MLFNNENEFSLHIETLKIQQKTSYVETILNFCEEKDIDVEEVTPLINKSLREKIADEVKLGSKRSELEDDYIGV